MKIILTIGYQHFLLPASANVNAIISVLNKSTPLNFDKVGEDYVYVTETDTDRAKLKIEMVDDNKVIDPAKVKRKALSESASADAHNTF